VPPEERVVPGPREIGARVVGAIPARYGSTRLPGKPLREIAGRSLIEHVYRRAEAADALSEVVVLTDDERIAARVRDFGGRCEMTPETCASGTDRVAWAARRWSGVSAVVNIQGDEPLIDPSAINRLARHLVDNPGDPVATLAAPAAPGDLDNPDVVKVVVDKDGGALYFSRAGIPHPRHEGGAAALRHVGIYGYQLAALFELSRLPVGGLEATESLEQLRALENGIRIRVLPIERAWWGVDTIDDLERVESFLKTDGAAPER
jgi:3-deoxy-manno-octulosonate cytidylyltransferase (CMP-KDO synthetase)